MHRMRQTPEGAQTTQFTQTTERAETTEIVAILRRTEIYEFHDAEDGHTYWWNATEGRRLAEERNAEIVIVNLPEMGMTVETIRRYCPDLDTAKALALPIEVLLLPLLFVPHNGKHVLIDGTHRIYRASIEGINSLPAYILRREGCLYLR